MMRDKKRPRDTERRSVSFHNRRREELGAARQRSRDKTMPLNKPSIPSTLTTINASKQKAAPCSTMPINKTSNPSRKMARRMGFPATPSPPTSPTKKAPVSTVTTNKTSLPLNGPKKVARRSGFPAKPEGETAATGGAPTLTVPVTKTSGPVKGSKMARRSGVLEPLSPKTPSEIEWIPSATIGESSGPGSAQSSPLPRIGNMLTVAELQEEASCRGLVRDRLPTTKADLLALLVDGSIHLKKTGAWKQVEALKEQMENEKSDLISKAQRLGEVERREPERYCQISEQKLCHTHSFPRAHDHPLALSKELKLHSRERCHANIVCDSCKVHVKPFYTCEACDFDICHGCCIRLSMFSNELDKSEDDACKKMDGSEDETEDHDYDYSSDGSDAEVKLRIAQWDATKQFKKSIITPSEQNKSPNGNQMKGYTVWCATGYQDDGFHSGNGPLISEFESTWKNADEANARARYMFYWKNCWDQYPDELVQLAECLDEWEEDGLKHFTCIASDSCEWSVGVILDIGFCHMPNSSTERADYDDEEPPKGSVHTDARRSSFLFNSMW